jgi:vacuolar-type H+-ATPase subunit E/Vma4
MTEGHKGDPEAAITEKILADAHAQAERLIENAGRGASAERQKTDREIVKVEEDIRAGWNSKVEKVRMREVSTARIESRRILLNAREKAVTKMFDEIEQGLGRLRENPGRYREALRNLAAEAATAVGGDEVILRFSERDRGLVNDAFVNEVTGRVKSIDESIRFRVEFDRDDTGGGCIATSADGRILFDNTFGRRLERLRPELRAMIVRELAKDDE